MLWLKNDDENILIKGVNVDVYAMNNFYDANVNFHGRDTNTCKCDIDTFFHFSKQSSLKSQFFQKLNIFHGALVLFHFDKA